MKLMKTLIMTSLVAALSFTATASEQQNTELQGKVAAKLGLNVFSVKESAINGLFEALTERGIFYVSPDARYIVRGNIYDSQEGLVNLTELAMGEMRSKKLASYEASMISYPAKDEKYKVTVFTDVDCGYCRKLHTKIPQYNALGITIRYLAFPRGGERSKAWSDMQSLWCSKDQRKAMDDLKAGSTIAQATCPNRVPEHYNLGIEFGVTGTPAIILDDGTMIPGYQEPRQLFNALKG